MEDADIETLIQRISDPVVIPAALSLKNAPSTVWIAAGLAKISALYGVSMMQRITGAPCRFVTALEYGQNQRIKCLPVLTSLRGNHLDAVEVAESIAARGGEVSILITGDPEGGAARHLKEQSKGSVLASDNLPDRDKRFVNLKSILMLSALTHRLVEQALGYPAECALKPIQLWDAWSRSKHASINIANQIKAVVNWQSKQFFILSDGITSELSLTWQSILSEAGVINPVCLDIKDFTHGDHLAATRTGNAMYLVISHEGTESVAKTFSSRFKTLFPVMNLDLPSSSQYCFWENLFTASNTSSLLTGFLGYPNLRPPKHPVVWGWRGWGSIHPTGSISEKKEGYHPQ